jgi:hypothetical protein
VGLFCGMRVLVWDLLVEGFAFYQRFLLLDGLCQRVEV